MGILAADIAMKEASDFMVTSLNHFTLDRVNMLFFDISHKGCINSVSNAIFWDKSLKYNICLYWFQKISLCYANYPYSSDMSVWIGSVPLLGKLID